MTADLKALLREALPHISHESDCVTDMHENWPCHCIRARIAAALEDGCILKHCTCENKAMKDICTNWRQPLPPLPKGE